jgi:hypothetical protein
MYQVVNPANPNDRKQDKHGPLDTPEVGSGALEE